MKFHRRSSRCFASRRRLHFDHVEQRTLTGGATIHAVAENLSQLNASRRFKSRTTDRPLASSRRIPWIRRVVAEGGGIVNVGRRCSVPPARSSIGRGERRAAIAVEIEGARSPVFGSVASESIVTVPSQEVLSLRPGRRSRTR
jgi:hypothetical protein